MQKSLLNPLKHINISHALQQIGYGDAGPAKYGCDIY